MSAVNICKMQPESLFLRPQTALKMTPGRSRYYLIQECRSSRIYWYLARPQRIAKNSRSLSGMSSCSGAAMNAYRHQRAMSALFSMYRPPIDCPVHLNPCGSGDLKDALSLRSMNCLKGRCPRRGVNSYLRYPCLKNFFHNCLITNDLNATKGWLSPLQAAFSTKTCLSSCQPSI